MPDQAAATVVPIRDGADGLEVLMVHRSSGMAFGGMWVFPGGRVDASDGDTTIEGELAVAGRAAVREALEEAALVVDPQALVPFSHWTPPPEAPRRYLTWFFLAPISGIVDIVVDGTEIHDHTWVTPEMAMQRRDAGDVELAPPTWMTLRRLASSPDVRTALEEARAREPERFATRVATHDGAGVMLWVGDAGFESGDPAVPGPRHRLVVDPAGWRYEGSSS
jgi:8-oxo-dGTP pyrophosphatase MutT (NUDIX family)